MAITEAKIKEALRSVIDPDLEKDIISLDMVKNITIGDNTISFTVTLATPANPYKEKIKSESIKAVQQLAQVDVDVTMSHQVSKSRVEGQGDHELLKDVKNIIAVASGKGGVGKSSVAVNMGCALSQSGAKVGIVDTDIYGPSIPTMFGLTERPKINDEKKLIPLEKYNIKLLSMGLLVDEDQAVVWRGPMVSSAVKQFLSDTEWGELDYLILDLPPGTGDIQLTIVQSVPLTGAVIVSTPQDVALDDARKGVAMFNKVNVPVLGVVENMAYFIPPDLPDNKYYIFGRDGARKLAEKLEVPFLGEVPLEQKLREGADSGTPIVISEPEAATSTALTGIANGVARQIAIRNHADAPQEKINVMFK